MTPVLSYSYGKYTDITVKITVAAGTSAQLQKIGIAANIATIKALPLLPTTISKGWVQTNVRFKAEGTNDYCSWTGDRNRYYK